MSYKIKLGLHDIAELPKKISNMQRAFEIAEKETVKEIADGILEEIRTTYTPNMNEEPVSFFKVGSENEYRVGTQGSSAVYHEYGTGTIGERNPHPNKEGKGLNAYNSGKTIRENTGITGKGDNITGALKTGIPLNEKYWTFKKDGSKIYTQGVASGKEVFNAVQKVKKNKQKIFNQKVGEQLSKL